MFGAALALAFDPIYLMEVRGDSGGNRLVPNQPLYEREMPIVVVSLDTSFSFC